MPSRRDPKNSAYWPCLRHIWQVTAYFRRPDHMSSHDLQRDTAFRLGLNRILICDAQPKVDPRYVRAMSGSGTPLDRPQ